MILLLGCAAGLNLGRATVLAPGEVEVAAGVDATVLSARMGPDTDALLPWPQLALSAHGGVAHDWELGGRAWAFGWPGYFLTLGFAADTKVQVHRSQDPAAPDLALVLSAVYHRPALGGAPWHIGGPQAALLIGCPVGRGELTLSPRAGAWYVTSYGQAPIFTVSGGVGLAWAIPVGRVDLVPEVVWQRSPLHFDGALREPQGRGAGGIELGMSVRWGRRRGD